MEDLPGSEVKVDSDTDGHRNRTDFKHKKKKRFLNKTNEQNKTNTAVDGGHCGCKFAHLEGE